MEVDTISRAARDLPALHAAAPVRLAALAHPAARLEGAAAAARAVQRALGAARNAGAELHGRLGVLGGGEARVGDFLYASASGIWREGLMRVVAEPFPVVEPRREERGEKRSYSGLLPQAYVFPSCFFVMY